MADKDKTATVEIQVTTDNFTVANAVITVKTVDKMPLTISSASMPERVYNGSAYSYTGTPTFTNTTDNNTVTGVTFTKEYEGRNTTSYTKSETAPTNAGEYYLILTVSGASADTYAGTLTVPFAIIRKEVTVKAKDRDILVGAEIPSLANPVPDTDYTVAGFIGTDTLCGTVSMSYTGTPDNTQHGSYPITISGGRAGSYYLGYVEWASKNGIVKGTSTTTFAPDSAITREQMAMIMQNYAKAIGFNLPKVHTEINFADNAKISTYAKAAVKQMQMAGVLTGKNDNRFDPQGTATRAEVSAVLKRFVELAISTDTADGWTLNDSGKWMYYENGKPVTGKRNLGGTVYEFNQYGVTADVPKNRKYTTYIVQKGDSFWLIAYKQGCTMSELEQLNNKSRFSIICAGEVLKVPETK